MSLLDASALAALVDRFYEKVRVDALHGPVFNRAVHDGNEHKRRLTSFWASVALLAGSYHGNPMSVHRAQPAIRGEHFERWLRLRCDTTRELLDEAAAAQMLDYAERIGHGLRLRLGLPEQTPA